MFLNEWEKNSNLIKFCQISPYSFLHHPNIVMVKLSRYKSSRFSNLFSSSVFNSGAAKLNIINPRFGSSQQGLIDCLDNKIVFKTSNLVLVNTNKFKNKGHSSNQSISYHSSSHFQFSTFGEF